MIAPWISSLFFSFFFIFSFNRRQFAIASSSLPPSERAPVYGIPTTANRSTSWINDESSLSSISFPDGSMYRAILRDETNSSICGFFCIQGASCTSYLFAILLNRHDPVVIWSANRDYPIRNGAILNLTAANELVLYDVDGSKVWATNTTGKSIAGMKLNDNGNLVLFDGDNSMVWQSFDHPTDCLVAGQKLFQGQKLIPSVSSTNWAAQKDSYSLQVTNKGLFAYVESNPPLVYYRHLVNGTDTDKQTRYVEFFNGNLSFFNFSTEPSLPKKFPLQYMKLMPNGHLTVFEYDSSVGSVGWMAVADLLTGDLGECFYPLACGRNGICSGNQECSCPRSSFPGMDSFRAVNDSEPNMGCSQVNPLTCNATQDQHFIELKNVKYFTYTADMEDVDMETCKQACLGKCSCKAAIFEYGDPSHSNGNCYLPTELFTMTKVNVENAIVYIKIQNERSNTWANLSQPQPHDSVPKTKNQVKTVVGSIIGSFVLLLIVVIGFTKLRDKKKKTNTQMEEEFLDQVPGMPTRFSYEELKTATGKFSKKLGEGGFGSVFEGTLRDGSMIAVKCLESLVHVKKSFLAEVESIGSIHHVNLVQLRGFCAWRSQRLLVYEFMSNGSLDQWIYHGDRKHVLKWDSRKKIILDISKGLAYLHEECRQKIIHLDIKPQNILLDEHFNAKVSDFGLAKLMDRDQSQVRTRMRGTPGYLAPEWLGSVITEKVDVYSFGIVLLEILCGRKNFDKSLPEESWHLLRVFERCWEHGTLLSIVDRYSEDMQIHGTEVVEMMKVASWCLQTDFRKRPSMSVVIKVLTGVINVESNLDYKFSYTSQQKTTVKHGKTSLPLLPSILSGPR